MGEQGTCAPFGVQIHSISCSFWQNLPKLYIGPRGELAPPSGYPGSATDYLGESCTTISAITAMNKLSQILSSGKGCLYWRVQAFLQ